MSLTAKEWLTYIIILILTFLFFWLCVPKNNYKPVGIALPMPKATAMQIKNSPNWTSKKTPIAWVNIEYHVKQDTPAAEKLIKQEALALAKSVGGTSIILPPIFFNPATDTSPMLSTLIAQGIAVK